MMMIITNSAFSRDILIINLQELDRAMKPLSEAVHVENKRQI